MTKISKAIKLLAEIKKYKRKETREILERAILELIHLNNEK
jgi:hypothetical protein